MNTPTEKAAIALDYLTPPVILSCVRAYFGGPIPLDPATFRDNPTGARAIYTAEDNGLTHSWVSDGVFVNPPYGPMLRPFMEKLAAEAERGTPILTLLPVNRSEQGYWQAMVRRASAVCWIRKRVAFLRPITREVAKGNPYSSAIWGFNVHPGRFVEAFWTLGLCQLLAPGGAA